MKLLPILLLIPFASLAAVEDSYLEPARNIKISSPEPGVISEMLVKEGQAVKKDDVLVKLDTKVLEVEASMAAEESLMLERRLAKLKELLPKRFASPDEVAATESQLKIAQLKRERALAQIERLTLRSPIDGVVTEVRFDPAESLTGPNEHVVTIVQLQPMQVQFNVPVAEVPKIKEGDTVNVDLPDLGKKVSGRVEFVSPVPTAVVNTTRVKVQLADTPAPAGSKARLALP